MDYSAQVVQLCTKFGTNCFLGKRELWNSGWLGAVYSITTINMSVALWSDGSRNLRAYQATAVSNDKHHTYKFLQFYYDNCAQIGVILSMGTRVADGMFVGKLNWCNDRAEKETDIIDLAKCMLKQRMKKMTEEEKGQYNLKTRVLWTCLPRILWTKDITNPNGKINRIRQGFCGSSHRIERILISERLYPLYMISNLEDYKEAMRHIVLGIHFLAVSDQKMFHRDINRSSLMFRLEDGKVYGVINSFNLAEREDNSSKGHKCGQSWERPFMSISLHLDERMMMTTEYIERFDLESILYVMWWEVRLSNKGKLFATEEAQETYKKWIELDDKNLHDFKRVALWDIREDLINESYRPLCWTWLRPLCRIFADGYSELLEYNSNCEGTETCSDFSLPDGEELIEFDYDTLGGHVTFEKIWEIMGDYPMSSSRCY